MVLSATRVGLLVALAVAFGFAWYAGEWSGWRARLEDRFVYGVPWGTLSTVGVVVAFYLFAQGGLQNWETPVIYPFVTWSYFYPTGLLTAGIAHGSAGHIVSNMTGTLAFAPLAEYAWGHYAPSARRAASESPLADGRGESSGLLSRPWVRALVVFPAALLLAAFLTSFFSLGPGLGFSGAVFAIAGFALVNYPVGTVLAVVAASGLGTLYTALTEPIVRATIEGGPPAPPSWASIGFQAHMLGFLIGVVAGAALLSRRGRRPATARVFFATLLLGTVQALWLLVWVDGETFVLYRGAGLALVALLTVLIAAAAGGSSRPLPRPLSARSGIPTRRQLAAVWLGLLAVLTIAGAAGVLLAGEAVVLGVGSLLLLAALLALPALPPVVPDRVFSGPVSRRGAAVAAVAALAVLVAAPGIPFGLVAVDDDRIAGSEAVEIRDYRVAYAENATSDQRILVDTGNESFTSEQSGVIVASDDRELWTVGVREERLAFEGNDTVVVGGVGWREPVDVDRTGWAVLGNDTVYAVDLTVDGETTRSFRSEPATAAARLDGRTVSVAPTADGFELRVREDGSTVGETAVPEAGEAATVDGLEFETRVVDGTERVVATAADSEAQIAERETYR